MMDLQLIFNTTGVSPIYEKMRNSIKVGSFILTMNDGHRTFDSDVKLVKYFMHLVHCKYNTDCKETSPKSIEWNMDGTTFCINGDQWFSDFCGDSLKPVKFHEILDIFYNVLHFVCAKKLDKDNKFEICRSREADYLMLLISIGLNPDDVDTMGTPFEKYPVDDSISDLDEL